MKRLVIAALLLAALASTALLARPGAEANANTSFTQVSAGCFHTCGVKADGTLACWGRNEDGQATPPAGTFIQVSAGIRHTCGVKTDGTLACWGWNEYGQATPPAGTFSQVSAGGEHTCGVKTGSTLACWGDNMFGQAAPPGGTFTQVSAGALHTCGVKTDGTLACWGSNAFGEAAPPGGTFTQVSAGALHTCAVKTDDTLACWGHDEGGRAAPPDGSFSQVTAGGNHTCGVKRDGTLACWGRNEYGQATPPAGTFTQVSAGGMHTCAVKTDGTLACWGLNEDGRATPPTSTLTPTPIPGEGNLEDCPHPAKWALSVWNGDDGIDPEQAFATCGEGAVAVAYSIDPETQMWSRWFADRPEISNLTAIDHCQGVIALGSSVSAASSPSDERLEAAANANGMVGCPLQGRWAIAVWDGDDGTEVEEALATCGEDAVAVAYSIDPQTQAWSRWFDGRPEISNLAPLGHMQGVLALGGTGAPATPTPSPTLTPTATPTLTPTPTATFEAPTDYLDTFHASLEISMEADGVDMGFAIEGDFQATNRCSCDISVSIVGIPIWEERVIVIDNEAWIDTGDGWREMAPSDPDLAEALGLCPACPSFWESEGEDVVLPPGQHDTKNGVPAIHYTAEELYEAIFGVGPLPEELEDVSVETLDLWAAEDGGWLVCLDLELCGEGEAAGEFESVCIAFTIDITGANDPNIEVNAP
jgi:hypothetical protein